MAINDPLEIMSPGSAIDEDKLLEAIHQQDSRAALTLDHVDTAYPFDLVFGPSSHEGAGPTWIEVGFDVQNERYYLMEASDESPDPMVYICAADERIASAMSLEPLSKFLRRIKVDRDR